MRSSESRNAESEWKRSASRGGWKKDALDQERAAIVKHTQAKAQNLRHGRLSESVFKRRLVGFESRQQPSHLAFPVKLKRDSRLPPALREEHLESCGSFSMASLRSAFTPSVQRANPVFTVEEVNFLREIVRARGAYHYSTERVMDCRDESAF